MDYDRERRLIEKRWETSSKALVDFYKRNGTLDLSIEDLSFWQYNPKREEVFYNRYNSFILKFLEKLSNELDQISPEALLVIYGELRSHFSRCSWVVFNRFSNLNTRITHNSVVVDTYKLAMNCFNFIMLPKKGKIAG